MLFDPARHEPCASTAWSEARASIEQRQSLGATTLERSYTPFEY